MSFPGQQTKQLSRTQVATAMSIIKSLFSKPGAFGKGSSMEAKIVLIQEMLHAKVDHFCQLSVETSIASPTFVDCWGQLDVENDG